MPDQDPTFSQTTGLDDVRACFRLLLGRNPNPEEWEGHAMQVGEPLASVVASYLGSLEFSRRGLLRDEGREPPVLSELAEFQIYSAADDAAVGCHVRADYYEHDVAACFRRFLRPGMGVVDIGANIGYFTMLSASLVGPDGYVLAIEPNGRNVRLLEASRRANGFAQVSVVQVAAGPRAGMLALHRSHSNGTTSAPSGDIDALLDAETVGCARPDTLVGASRRIDLIKVDVEGAEYLALSGCTEIIARDRPVVISEFSPTLMPGISGISGPGYLSWLIDRGYAISVIMPDGTQQAETIDGVMAAFERRGTDHIDIIAVPLAVSTPAQAPTGRPAGGSDRYFHGGVGEAGHTSHSSSGLGREPVRMRAIRLLAAGCARLCRQCEAIARYRRGRADRRHGS